MFCINCGNKGPVTAKFCQECGTAVIQPAPAPAPVPQASPAAPVSWPSPAGAEPVIEVVAGALTAPGWADQRGGRTRIGAAHRHEAGSPAAVAILERPTFHSESMPPPPPAATKRKPWGLIILVTLFVLVPLSLVPLGMVAGEDEPSDVETAFGATSSLSTADQKLVEQIMSFPATWNEKVAPIVRDYNDPAVSGDQWVEDYDIPILALGVLVRQFESNVTQISDPGMRGVFQQLSANYRDKLTAVQGLMAAVKAGSGQDAAVTKLQQAAATGQALASNLLERLRPFMDEDELNRLIAGKADALREYMGG